QCPRLTGIPKSNPVVRGVAHIRGETIPIMDMGMAIGQPMIPDAEVPGCFVIITEYNRKTQGFLVKGVERIVNLNWETVHPPPKGSGKDVYLTAVTRIEDHLVEIIDVEKILSEVAPAPEVLSQDVAISRPEFVEKARAMRILVVDRSEEHTSELQSRENLVCRLL